jgi:hypothetical protein
MSKQLDPTLDPQEQILLDKVKGMFDDACKKAYLEGFRRGMAQSMEDEGLEGVEVRRIIISKYTLLALLIIVVGSIFSLGMYVGART